MVKLVFVVFDGMTLLDFAGVFDPLTRLRSMGFAPDLEYHICARDDRVRSSEGTVLVPDKLRPDLSDYDYVLIPGGDGIRNLIHDREFLSWLSIAPGRTVLAAVCGGALLLGATGRLRDRRATTHPVFLEALRHFAREVSSDRIVEDGDTITAGGVTAAIDLGLYLCERIAGADVREQIRIQMDYRCPPVRAAR